MKMNVKKCGIDIIGKVKVLEITDKYISVKLDEKEYKLPFSQYPWFEYCTIKEISSVYYDGTGLCWDDAGIDLEIEMIKNPDKAINIISLEKWIEIRKKTYSIETGKIGGSSKSKAKIRASRLNGKIGGRPAKIKEKILN